MSQIFVSKLHAAKFKFFLAILTKIMTALAILVIVDKHGSSRKKFVRGDQATFMNMKFQKKIEEIITDVN